MTDVPGRERVSPYNPANALTVARLLLVPLFGWLLLRHGGADPASRLGAGATFAVAMVTDRVDGEVARRRQQVTDVGKIADPIADKALTGTAFVGLSLLGELPWWVTAVVLTRELGVTGVRLVVLHHAVLPAGRGGKAKVVLQAVALGLYLLPVPADLVLLPQVAMAVAVGVTVVTGVDYVVQAVRLRRDARRRGRNGGGSGAAVTTATTARTDTTATADTTATTGTERGSERVAGHPSG